jgi:cytochrome c oxidase subunit 2
MVVAILLLLVAAGSVVFHLITPWWWTPIASNWGNIDDMIVLTFWITGTVYVAIIVFTAYCVMRFEYKEGRRSEYKPEDKRLELWLTGLTTLGVAGLLAPGLVVWNDYVTVPKQATPFEVLGQQWQWSYRLPGKDGKLGTSDTRNVSDTNSFGLNPKDANGQDDVLIEADDLHLPVGKPVKALLRSIDVLHDFYVPQFRAKMDLVPGMVTYFWFTPTKPGTYEVLCAELCGIAHHAMRSTVVVDNEADYTKWLAKQTTFAQMQAQAMNRNGGGRKFSLLTRQATAGRSEQGMALIQPNPVKPVATNAKRAF